VVDCQLNHSIVVFLPGNSIIMDLLSPHFSVLFWTLFLVFIPGTLIFCLFREKKLVPKILWSLVIVCFPFVGAMIYLLNALIARVAKPAELV
jgi:uncharacterized membrane protein